MRGEAQPFQCRRLLLATGVVDELPPLPGIEPMYGNSVCSLPDLQRLGGPRPAVGGLRRGSGRRGTGRRVARVEPRRGALHHGPATAISHDLLENCTGAASEVVAEPDHAAPRHRRPTGMSPFRRWHANWRGGRCFSPRRSTNSPACRNRWAAGSPRTARCVRRVRARRRTSPACTWRATRRPAAARNWPSWRRRRARTRRTRSIAGWRKRISRGAGSRRRVIAASKPAGAIPARRGVSS